MFERLEDEIKEQLNKVTVALNEGKFTTVGAQCLSIGILIFALGIKPEDDLEEEKKELLSRVEKAINVWAQIILSAKKKNQV